MDSEVAGDVELAEMGSLSNSSRLSRQEVPAETRQQYRSALFGRGSHGPILGPARTSDKPLACSLVCRNDKVPDMGPPWWFVSIEHEEELIELSTGDLFPSRVDLRVVEVRQGVLLSDADPVILLRLRVQDGRPVVVSASVLSVKPTGLTAADVRFPFDKLTRLVTEWVAKDVDRRLNPPPTAAEMLGEHLPKGEWTERNAAVGERASSSRRQRRPVTDARLQEVAAIYRRDTSGKPTEAVARACIVAYSTAARLVGQARERGFLPAYEPSKPAKVKQKRAGEPAARKGR
jgi:hypothetical protein